MTEPATALLCAPGDVTLATFVVAQMLIGRGSTSMLYGQREEAL